MTKDSSRLIILSCLLILMGCSLGKTDFPSPPSYRGITPGQTTKEEVLSILGEPDKVSVVDAENWQYWNYFRRVIVVLSLDAQVVDWIWIVEQTHTLGEIIDEYGEPELVQLGHPDSCSPDEYMVTNLEYPGQGINAVLWEIPPYSRDFIITDMFYFEPMMIEAYFEHFGDVRDCRKIIEWPGFEE